MPQRIAHLLSVFFHPIFVPLFALFLIFHSDTYLAYHSSPEARRMLYIIVFILTVAMPGLSTYILVKNQMVSNITLPEKRDRTAPYLITAFYYALLYYLLRRIPHIPPPLLSMVLGAICTLVLSTIINFRFRLSAHTAGISGIIGIYAALSGSAVLLPERWVICSLILLAGIIGTARLLLNAHRPHEIYLGAAVGFLSEYVFIRYQIFL
ncbi:MAG TPA: hypothetical protein DEP18_07165 [Flavobacteriales bacterium]|nr:hypothetical protein [Flavobacteriales bacterium]HRE75305.1 hypothetical protein [Flavobacteriales bacterium]HRE95867.1 hypothetical protein [Flavobacteriales bacterium]HRJ36910.1 hypothetical protein [Flavobacteriales bacterium]HRJ37633.1 hypothetical protein [Flavobacteriales bacterium]